ncbi:MAG: prepilin-type N-terminal cleavage/methylation domain-containing protein [Thiolinea sp.]
MKPGLRSGRGFSLLEVLLVLVLGALLMGVVATSLTEGPVLRKSAREVASVCAMP